MTARSPLHSLHPPALPAALLLTLVLVLQAAAGSALLELRPAGSNERWRSAGGVRCQPEAGGIVVVGQVDSPDFSVGALTQVAMETAEGERIPLLIDERSIVSQLGRVIACRFAACVPARLVSAATNGPSLVLRWGDAITGTNQVVAGFRFDTPAGEACWLATCGVAAETPAAVAVDRELRVALRAEGGADRQRYWHLAPLAVLLLLVFLRRCGAGDARQAGE